MNTIKVQKIIFSNTVSSWQKPFLREAITNYIKGEGRNKDHNQDKGEPENKEFKRLDLHRFQSSYPYCQIKVREQGGKSQPVVIFFDEYTSIGEEVFKKSSQKINLLHEEVELQICLNQSLTWINQPEVLANYVLFDYLALKGRRLESIAH